MVIAINIHDMWLIEEKAISLRSFITFNPPRAPTIAENREDNVIRNRRAEEKVK